MLELDEIPLCEARKHGDDDQRRAGDNPGGRADAPPDGGRRVARLVVALLDPAEQKDLVVHREPEQHREEEERHPGLDHVNVLEAEELVSDALEEDEDEQPVRCAHREQVEQDCRQGDDDRPEGECEQDERQPQDQREDVRGRIADRVEVVDVLGRPPADEDGGVGAGKRARNRRRSQFSHGCDRTRSCVVAVDRHVERGNAPVRRVADHAAAELGVRGKPSAESPEGCSHSRI